MARPKTSFDARLAHLKKAKARAAKVRVGKTLSADPMSKLLGVTWQTLRGWCDELDGFEASGCYVRGGNGIEWEFDAHKTLDFLLAWFQARIDAQHKSGRSLTQNFGIDMPEEETAVSIASIKDMANLTMSMVGMAEKQKRYVLADRMAMFVAGYNQTVVDAILGVGSEIDPNGNLPVPVRAKVDEALRRVAVEVHAAATKFLEANGAALQQEAIG